MTGEFIAAAACVAFVAAGLLYVLWAVFSRLNRWFRGFHVSRGPVEQLAHGDPAEGFTVARERIELGDVLKRARRIEDDLRNGELDSSHRLHREVLNAPLKQKPSGFDWDKWVEEVKG